MNTNRKNADDRMLTSKTSTSETSRGMEIELELELGLSEVCCHGID